MRKLCALLILASAIALTACSGGGRLTENSPAPFLVSITVTPARLNLSRGTEQQFTATGTYSDNSTADLTSSVTWMSSDTSVAVIDRTGMATLLSTGSTIITALSGTVSGSATVTVSDLSSESPFGFKPALVDMAGYASNGYSDAQTIGVKWTHGGLYAFWFLIQPDLNSPDYEFSLFDSQWGAVPGGMKIVGTIAPQGNTDEGYCISNSYLPIDEQKYIAFVKATVERYDGDGMDDMPGLDNPITYWQVGNEPTSETPGFAGLQRITYNAIKDVCSGCQVLIGGVPGTPPAADYIDSFDQQYRPILDELGGNYVDIMDFHWYGEATGDYLGAKQVYDHIRSALQADGFPASLPIWVTEMGSYSGDPVPDATEKDYPPQTEEQQALDYFKRFVYSLSFGIKKIFPAFGLMEGFKHNNSYFDHTGLIYDGSDPDDKGLGVKKLGYFTYWKMTEILEGSDWSSVEAIQESENVYIYRFMKGGRAVYAAWWDYFNDGAYAPGKTADASLSGLAGAAIVTEVVPRFATGSEITDYARAFTQSEISLSNGSLTLTLGTSPVLVEIVH